MTDSTDRSCNTEPYILILGHAVVCSGCGRPVNAGPDGEVNPHGWTPLKAECPTHGTIYGVLPPADGGLEGGDV